jgi:hypothetical protein
LIQLVVWRRVEDAEQAETALADAILAAAENFLHRLSQRPERLG